MKRTLITIDEDICNGCGNCVSGCHEGALQLVDGKAVVISDLYCDGLGACIGDCPVGAITLEEREAEPYDERAVMERLIPKGLAAIKAHLEHLRQHGESAWVEEGMAYLHEKGINMTPTGNEPEKLRCGCPGTMAREIKRPVSSGTFRMPFQGAAQKSELSHFPVQLALVNPSASFFRDSDLLLAADCTAFTCGDFHGRLLKGKTLAVACPKLDSNLDVYQQKLVRMIDEAKIKSMTVAIMEVPCCRGLLQLAKRACELSERKIPLYTVMVSVTGEISTVR